MSWASRRRFTYLTGVTFFFLIVLGGPLAWWYFTIPPTCTDNIQNQGETSIDKGGPCPILDERLLQPEQVLWVRSFRVRDGRYNSIAYIQNPNQDAGVLQVSYRFGLYDDRNVLVAERTGSMYIMPGVITPVIESRIDTGNRIVTRTYFEFTSPLVWRRYTNSASSIQLSNQSLSDIDSVPRLSADVRNTSVGDLFDVSFTAVVFDPAGNAFAASGTTLPKIAAAETSHIVFTWPDPFSIQPGRFEILPLVLPAVPKGVQLPPGQ